MRTLLAETCPPEFTVAEVLTRPRLGHLSVDGIGRKRMEMIPQSGAGEIIAVADCIFEATDGSVSPARALDSLNDLLEVGLDGVVIATPSALNAEQAILALERGVAVFCHGIPGRTADELRRVIDAARAANRLLAVDLPYRLISSLRQISDLCRQGELGEIYAAELTFHNPESPELSDGGCVNDPGIHLLDLALRSLNFPAIARVSSRLFARGKPVDRRRGTMEDYATARIESKNGAVINLTCSWTMPAGRNIVITGSFHGTRGGAAFSNIGGSLFNFTAERFHEIGREHLPASPDPRGGNAMIAWARQLADGGAFDPEIENLCRTAAVLDAIYANSEVPGATSTA